MTLARRIPVLVFALCMPAITLAACGNSTSGDATILAPPRVVGSLVATWVGSVNGTFGAGTLTLALRADSTMTAESNNPNYCKVTGTWTVVADRFAATGRECAGLVVTFGAPVSDQRLDGTWSATNGSNGTFAVGR